MEVSKKYAEKKNRKHRGLYTDGNHIYKADMVVYAYCITNTILSMTYTLKFDKHQMPGTFVPRSFPIIDPETFITS